MKTFKFRPPRFLCFSLGFFCAQYAHAQRDAAYGQLGGNGILASVNYERGLSPAVPLRVHAGLGVYGLRETVLTVPLGLRYGIALRHAGSFIDIGAGATWTSADPELYTNVKHQEGYVPHGGWNFIPSVGYRHQGLEHWFTRIGFTPLVNRYGLIPLFEFSLGKVFGEWKRAKSS
jgi:hypothetical protein